jgi:hypothetical protein
MYSVKCAAVEITATGEGVLSEGGGVGRCSMEKMTDVAYQEKFSQEPTSYSFFFLFRAYSR